MKAVVVNVIKAGRLHKLDVQIPTCLVSAHPGYTLDDTHEWNKTEALICQGIDMGIPIEDMVLRRS